MWILLSLVYAFANAFYITYNDTRHYNGYILGIWRGFGVSFCLIPFLIDLSFNIPLSYVIILIIQGILIGIYDSHIFFASARFGGHTGAGFMATSILITVFLWWMIHINDFKNLLSHPHYFITLILILSAYSVSYWKMMQVHADINAEKYLYPAVFALAFMSIATHYIAIHGSNMYSGIIYYLTISCFVSGIYNMLLYLKTKKHSSDIIKPGLKDGIWLIFLSIILISAKTAAMRLCPNPGYVVALLLISPIIAETIKTHRFNNKPTTISTLVLLILLLILITTINVNNDLL